MLNSVNTYHKYNGIYVKNLIQTTDFSAVDFDKTTFYNKENKQESK
ncbi:hypothetical protein KIMC2_01800 [Xylocopilactobacillus apis]|uniref:Uncharacterized protein n=1 Tax=Xylocopilactobacillus apis TaxID=2932183 RepID=A0AAU9CWF8_9LACO|nr:hypothetical protein KIMC2_01800 [Xylocopilactobacillus apis]